MKILLIEDETPIASVVRQGLEGAFYEVEVATDGETGLRMAHEEAYALIILDVMLPKRDGWSICEALRSQRSRTPILMLTARDSVDDCVRGLELGADDFVTKPFHFDELLARVRAQIRRDKIHRSRTIRVADLEIDTTSRQVRRSGEILHLTPHEYALLEALAIREGTAVSRELIQQQAWMDADTYSNLVDVYVAMLRKKIDAGRPYKLIHTVHRAGYMLKGPDGETPGLPS